MRVYLKLGMVLGLVLAAAAHAGPPGSDGERGRDFQIIASITEEHFRHSEGSAVELDPGGRILLAWSRFDVKQDREGDDNSPATIVMAYSDDAGRSWSKPEPLPVGEARLNVMQAAFLKLEDRVQLYFSVREAGNRADKFMIESRDGGQSWSDRLQLTPGDRRYTGPNDRTIRLSSGRILLMCHTGVPAEEGEHLPVVAWSDDGGKTFQVTDPLDFEDTVPDYESAIHARTPARLHEPAVVELSDGSLYMLARSTRARFFEARSTDGGETWTTLKPSNIPAMTAPPYMRKLNDGRIALLWNRPTDEQLADPRFNVVSAGFLKRHTLMLSISDDDAKTWSEPVPIFNDGGEHGFAYPWFLELSASGEVLIFATRTPRVISPGDLVMTRMKLEELPVEN